MKNDDAVGRQENSIIKPKIGLWFGHKVPRSLGCSSSRLVAGSLKLSECVTGSLISARLGGNQGDTGEPVSLR